MDVLSRNKIFAHPERLADWLKTGFGRPITAELDPTNACSYSCGDCAGGRDDEASLSFSDMQRIIDELSGSVKGLVVTGGGEPLANPNTVRAIEYAAGKGMDVGLITSGYLLHNNDVPGLVERVRASCSWIRISLDASDGKTYAERKGVPADHFEQVLVNVLRLDPVNTECTVGLAYLTRNESFEALRRFAELSRMLGVDYAQFRPFHEAREEGHDLSERIEQTRNLETGRFKVIYPREKYVPMGYTYEQCFGDEFRVVVSATGDMYPDCYTRGMPEFAYGNLLQQSFEDIWYHVRRQDVFEGKLSHPDCPEMSRRDLLNQILWDVHQSRERLSERYFELHAPAENEHINFV
jgi:MoaA/NifB/PqqE/SkfB family radical SAM enzyme